MNECRCPSRYRIKTGQHADEIIQCVYYKDHTDDGISGHLGRIGPMWSDANEYHEPPPKPEPYTPWRVIDKDGRTHSAGSTRYYAEAECPPGGRVMRLFDADAVIQKPVDVAALRRLIAHEGLSLAPSIVATVLRSAGIPMTGGNDE